MTIPVYATCPECGCDLIPQTLWRAATPSDRKHWRLNNARMAKGGRCQNCYRRAYYAANKPPPKPRKVTTPKPPTPPRPCRTCGTAVPPRRHYCDPCRDTAKQARLEAARNRPRHCRTCHITLTVPRVLYCPPCRAQSDRDRQRERYAKQHGEPEPHEPESPDTLDPNAWTLDPTTRVMRHRDRRTA